MEAPNTPFTAATDTGLPVTTVPPVPTKTDLAPMQAGIADTQPVPVPAEAWTPQPAVQAAPAEAPLPAETPVAEQRVRDLPSPVEPVQHVPVAPVAESRTEPHQTPATAQPEPEQFSFALPPDSGLELVETRHAAPAPQSDAEAEAPRGPRRVRPPRVQVADEPLQMVETRPEQSPPAQ